MEDRRDRESDAAYRKHQPGVKPSAANPGGVKSWGVKPGSAKPWGLNPWGVKSWGMESWGMESWGMESWGAKSWGAKHGGGQAESSTLVRIIHRVLVAPIAIADRSRNRFGRLVRRVVVSVVLNRLGTVELTATFA